MKEAIEKKRPIDAETDAMRKQRWVVRLVGTDERIAEEILKNDSRVLQSMPLEKRTAAEKIQGGSIDFVPGVFIANQHVIITTANPRNRPWQPVRRRRAPEPTMKRIVKS